MLNKRKKVGSMFHVCLRAVALISLISTALIRNLFYWSETNTNQLNPLKSVILSTLNYTPLQFLNAQDI